MSVTKMNKTSRWVGRLREFILLKYNFIFTIKKILIFQPIRNFPLQIFWKQIRPKRDYKMVNESSKKAVGSETSKEKIVLRRIRTRTKNQTPYQSNSHSTLPQTAYSSPTHVIPPDTISNQLLKNNLHPLSSWTVIWWKKAHISPDIPIFIYLK